MAIATITSVKLPAHQYPHVEVNINDNTLRRYTTPTSEYAKTLCVFRSPKGPDGVSIVNGYEQFRDTYGEGSVAEYGQPLLNARMLASGNNVTMHCLRVTAPHAKVSNIHVFARYRVKNYNYEEVISDASALDTTIGTVVVAAAHDDVPADTVSVTGGLTVYTTDAGVNYINLADLTHDPALTGYKTFTVTSTTEQGVKTITLSDTVTPNTEIKFVPGKMAVYFVAKTDDDLDKVKNLVKKDKYSGDLLNKVKDTITGSWGDPSYKETYELIPETDYHVVEPTAPAEGAQPTPAQYGGKDTDWHEIRLFSIAALGRGRCGNDISFNITSDPNRDKSNAFKNYIVQVFEGSTLIEKFYVTLTSEGIVRKQSKFISNVVNDDTLTGSGSMVMSIDFNEYAMQLLYEEFNVRVNPGYILYNEFDPILNIDKRKVASKRTIIDKSMDGYYICTTAIGPDKNPDGDPYETQAAYTADLDSLDYFPLVQITEQVPPNESTEVPDDCAQFDFNAIVGSPLRGGNDGEFALVANGGTATSLDEIDTAVKAAYKAIFEGESHDRKATYKNITTVCITNNDDTITEFPVKNLVLYFDENNNYLLDIYGDDKVTTTDADRQSAFELALGGTAVHAFVAVDKASTKVFVPKKSERIYYTQPDRATAEFEYPEILSKNKTEIDFFLDANYDYDTKIAICNWTNNYRPEEFVVYLDAGLSDNLVSKMDAYTWVQAFDEATNGSDDKRYWYFSIDAYYGKIRDPYNYKIVEVTSTYNLARKLVTHWQQYNGKHIPYAGSLYAVIDTYIPKSVFPLMDEGIDSEHMDRFIEEHVNYAQINSRGDMIRATQSTRYPFLGDAFTLSNLTELNNVHVVLDIKKDVEHVLELFAYQFNEVSDLRRFNTIVASSVLPKYSAAQVKSISAAFNRTSEEAEYGILHLYIEVVHKNLVKIVMVDIDVNRNTD